MVSGRVGRYALVKMIGRGGMAEVWVGKVQGAGGFEKVVAIKLLSPDQVDREEYQRALTDEARIQVHLKHPNIVDVYDLNFEAENPYLVMEFVEGVELREVLRALRNSKIMLPSVLTGYIILEIAKALSYAHERRHPETNEPLHIVHRDVSPSNILISVGGDVKLSDFGIAKSSLQSAATQVGQIKGKFRYMSPEQAEGQALDSRSDIYALGLVLYECLTGAPAYDEPSDIGVLQRAREGRVCYPEGLDSEWKNVLDRLLARRPEDRYSQLKDLIRDVAELLRGKGMVADREALAEYLKGLNIPRLKDVAATKSVADQWRPEPTAQLLDQTGRIVTLAEELTERAQRRRLRWGLGGAVGLGGIAFASWLVFAHPFHSSLPPKLEAVAPQDVPKPPQFGSLHIDGDPRESQVKIHYEDVTLSRGVPVDLTDLPLNIPIEVSASKKGFHNMTQTITLTAEKSSQDVKLNLKEISGVQVRFSADPYAEVTIPGVVASLETPFARSMPAGEYTVTFRHPAAKKSVSTALKGPNGGTFLCSADMKINDAQATAVASCRSR